VARRAKAAAQGRRWLNLDCVARGGSGERNRVSGMNFLNLSAPWYRLIYSPINQ
jgi:hypothetical protein